jgi:proteasome lid subunit RPN8/RPN11
MTVEIGRSLLNALIAAAEASKGREICGLLFGTAARFERAQTADNVAERPEDSFEIDPRALFAALRAERAGGDRLIGHYHSHPNGRAEPSPRDLAAAEPGKYWLILGGGAARLWVMENDGFRELQLVVTD